MNVWNFIYHTYNKNNDVILLYVLTSTGSSPGRQGFRMAVAGDGTFHGSIGGGIMEHKFVELAKSFLQNSSLNKTDTYRQVHAKEQGSNHSGMICSGEQTIFLHRINSEDVQAIKDIIAAENDYKNATLLLTEKGVTFSADIIEENFFYEVKEGGFLLKEKISHKNTLHIIGGGHCGLALSQLMRQHDFYIHVYDERKGLATIQQNTFAHEIHIVDSYAGLGSLIEEKRNVFVVIMTFGYRSDDVAVRALIEKKFTYMGIMGSKKKIEKMFQAYSDEGIDFQKIRELYAPVGIQIKSQTPAEIAVSIAAEIIRVKNAGI